MSRLLERWLTQPVENLNIRNRDGVWEVESECGTLSFASYTDVLNYFDGIRKL